MSLLEQIDRRGAANAGELRDVLRELQSRLATLYRDMARSTAKPTADQQAQMQFLKTELDALRKRASP